MVPSGPSAAASRFNGPQVCVAHAAQNDLGADWRCDSGG
jgi:hypothetical protein